MVAFLERQERNNWSLDEQRSAERVFFETVTLSNTKGQEVGTPAS